MEDLFIIIGSSLWRLTKLLPKSYNLIKSLINIGLSPLLSAAAA